MHGGWGNGRQLWLHRYVEVASGSIVPMHHQNPDGSIDVLGAPVELLPAGFSIGSHCREKIQHSLLLHANMLREAGATIVRQTKNSLVARHGRETAYYMITETTARTFFGNLRKAG